MPHLSLTDFVDIVTRSGTPKLTKIRQIKGRPGYTPATDFWRPLRSRIVEAHASKRGPAHLDGIVADLTDQKKRTAYPPLITAYRAWWRKHEYAWIDPPSSVWRSGDVSVSVNPEIGLELEDRRFIIKLYFKSEKLAKNKIDVILYLMQEALGDLEPGAVMAIHDIRSKRMIVPSVEISGIAAMLRGEAAYIQAVWQDL